MAGRREEVLRAPAPLRRVHQRQLQQGRHRRRHRLGLQAHLLCREAADDDDGRRRRRVHAGGERSHGKGKDEALAKLHRLDAIGDDKVDAENPDLVDVANWIVAVNDSFAAKCRGASNYASTQEYLSTADAIIVRARPYWDTSLSSPDGSGP